jgi:hypothetical protein
MSNNPSSAKPSESSEASRATADKNAALIHLFEKMGVPLINAVAAVKMWQDTDANKDVQKDPAKEAVEYATNLAGLLNRTVSLSTALSQKLELSPSTDQKHRLDIAAVSTLMIAHQYALMARIPEDSEIPKVISSLESVLSFADYFSDSASAKAPQKNQDELLVECLEAVVPLVQTIGRFSFGRNEKTLISEILSELGTRVDTLAKAFGQDLKNRNFDEQKISLFKAAAQLLTMCYEAEMNSLMQNNSGKSGEAAVNDEALDKVFSKIWENFDARASLLRTVLGFVNNFFTGDTANLKMATSAQSAPQEQKTAPEKSKTQQSETPSAPSGFSPIQAIIDRAEGKDVSKPSSSDSEGEDGKSDGDNSNPMSFFT